MNIDVVINCRDILGESPLYIEAQQTFYWVDIGRRAWCSLNLDSGLTDVKTFDTALTGFAPTNKGRFIGAFEDGLAFFSSEGKRETFIHQPELELPENRFNDAGTDPKGRFLAGSMNKIGTHSSGALYSLDSSSKLSTLRKGIGIFNTVAFSPDGSVIYTADTSTGELFAFGYDANSGELGERIKSFCPAPDLPGAPDGSAVDLDGYIWNARWGGHCLVRLAPDGRTDRIVELPVQNPTSCTFVGEDLFITSSTWEYSEEDLKNEPLAGSVLRLNVGVSATPSPVFREA